MAEPRPLFPSDSPSGAGGCTPKATASADKQNPAREPGPLFQDGRAVQAATDSSKAVPDSSPRPLVFTDLPRNPAPNPVAPLFQAAEHASLAGAEAAAGRREPDLYRMEEARVRRCINKLLPLTLERVQDYADGPLRSAREQTLACVDLVSRFSRLRASETLDAALASATGTHNLLGRVKSRFSAPPGIQQLEAIAGAMQTLANEVATALKPASETELRLAVHLLALRGVADLVSHESRHPASEALHLRANLLQAALTQAKLLVAQLEQLRGTLASLDARYEQVMTVTLSTGALAASALKS